MIPSATPSNAAQITPAESKTVKGLFIPNVKSFSDAWANSPDSKVDQSEWEKRWNAVSQEAAKLLETYGSQKPDPRIKTAKDFFVDFLGKKRQEEAKHFKHDQQEYCRGLDAYGISRSQDTVEDRFLCYLEIVVPHQGRYKDAYAAYKQRVAELCSQPTQDEKAYTVYRESGTHILSRYYSNAFTTYGNYINENNEPYRAPYITVTLVKLTDFEQDVEYIVNTKMPSRRIEDFFRAIEPLYQKIIGWKKGGDPKQFYYDLGLLSWHTAVAMPLRLGSTAVNECMIRAFEIAKGFEPKPFRAGVTVDFRAYYTPHPEEFAAIFYSLFEGHPHSPKVDPFTVASTPTAAATALEDKWQEIKQDFQNKVFNPANENLIPHPVEYTPSPLINYAGIPKRDKNPSRLRTLQERMEINWYGFDEHRRRMELFTKNRIALLEEISKKPDKAKVDNKTEVEVLGLRKKIQILKKPGGFEAIFLYIHNEWLNDSNKMERSMQMIEKALYNHSEDEIEYIRDKYNSRREIALWLETLEPQKAHQIYQKIEFTVRDYRLEEKNGKFVLVNLTDSERNLEYSPEDNNHVSGSTMKNTP